MVDWLSGGSDSEVLNELPLRLASLDEPGSLELFSLLEDSQLFVNRLPLRLQIYAKIATPPIDGPTAFQSGKCFTPSPEMRVLALERLLRRMGARKDIPDLDEIPETLTDFADYLASSARTLLGETPLAGAVGALAFATKASRAGDICEMGFYADKGLEELYQIIWHQVAPD